MAPINLPIEEKARISAWKADNVSTQKFAMRTGRGEEYQASRGGPAGPPPNTAPLRKLCFGRPKKTCKTTDRLLKREPTLGVVRPTEALLYIILSPVGPYFASGFKPVSLLADPRYVRAWPGGVGMMKMGSNYGPTLEIQRQAEKRGLQQVLWLFGPERRITEVGAMNIMVLLVNDSGDILTVLTGGRTVSGASRQCGCLPRSPSVLLQPSVTLHSLASALGHTSQSCFSPRSYFTVLLQPSVTLHSLASALGHTSVLLQPTVTLHSPASALGHTSQSCFSPRSYFTVLLQPSVTLQSCFSPRSHFSLASALGHTSVLLQPSVTLHSPASAHGHTSQSCFSPRSHFTVLLQPSVTLHSPASALGHTSQSCFSPRSHFTVLLQPSVTLHSLASAHGHTSVLLQPSVTLHSHASALEKEMVTPPLDGLILPGVTRDSLLTLARSWGEFKVSERDITMGELEQASTDGRLLEMFGAGTAAVVTPVGEIHYEGRVISIPAGGDSLAQRFYDTITGIQYGKIASPCLWSTMYLSYSGSYQLLFLSNYYLGRIYMVFHTIYVYQL
ncbi:Branched-chain-amino-acid aminotransferase [Chionoecetes opilio]|uniref:Branched-chain-amino-acid aminotransferase n=1 Tax=Chionoecetes opilio TaxID=41210 RepID=A0A8J5CXK6_CHIOP|nr:Branched-chain-amino-acid aminotransferase [Chionoecetes opilio]